MLPFASTRRQFTLGLGAAAGVLGLGNGALGQTSDRPVTFIVPFSAGSGPDTVARLLAQYLGKKTGQSYVVDNRVGASGNIGTAAVARAAPDGQTFLVTANTLVMNTSLFKTIPYDPVANFAPVAGIVYSVFACAVHKSLGVNSLAELVALAKAKPGVINFGSPGLGAPHHVALELFKQKAGVDIKHVPYRQLSGAMTDLAGGHIGGMFMPALQAVSLSKAGDVKVLAFSGASRAKLDPSVPTMTEAGTPGIDIDNWWAILAPHGTPADIVARYNAGVNEMLAEPDIKARLDAQALEAIGGPPERLKEMISRDQARWAQVLQRAGVVPE
jgi:tripartite-type tricarboxylate transporter receptor subunit TctC